MIKYIFLNLLVSRKLYIPFFALFMLVTYTMLSSFSIRANLAPAYEQDFGRYAAVAIINNGISSNINEDFAKEYFIPEYAIDYYAFFEHSAGSDMLNSTIDTYDKGDLSEELLLTYQYDESTFTLLVYSDITKSTYFRFGDRKLKNGRLAENTSECIISSELAEMNSVAIGDCIEIYLNFAMPAYFQLSVVGIYEDSTETVSNELDVLNFKHISPGRFSAASIDSISRNQILTVSPLSQDTAIFSLGWREIGFDVLVYYIDNARSAITYVDEVSDFIPEQYTMLNSADTLREIISRIDAADRVFSRFLAVLLIGGVVFCVIFTYLILKERTYDIGVFRSRGMPRVKIATLLSCEVLVICALAYISSWALFSTTFSYVSKFLYNEANTPDLGVIYRNYERVSPIYDYTFSVIISPGEYAAIALILAAPIIVVSVFAVLLISRHEPMNVMTEH